jgi:hypothetical protein
MSLTGSSKWVDEKSAAEARCLAPGARHAEPDAALVADHLRPPRFGVPAFGSN